METKHTPGPWKLHKNGVIVLVRGYGGTQHIAHADEVFMSRVEREANARLIAAAPELLALMQDVLPILESMDHQREEGDEPMPLIEQVRAAIAKATGNK